MRPSEPGPHLARIFAVTDLASSLNLLLRGAVVGVLAVIAMLLWRAQPRALAPRLGAGLAVSLVATMLVTLPGFAAVPPGWRLLVAALAPGSLFLLWLFTAALFDDGFRLRSWHVLGWLGLMALGVAAWAASWQPEPPPWAAGLHRLLDVMPVFWALLAIGQSAASWRGDLLERRRALRTLVVAGIALFTVGQLVVALLWSQSLQAVAGSAGQAAGALALALLVAWRLLRADADAADGLFGLPATRAGAPAVAGPASTQAADRGTGASQAPAPPDARQVAALEALMSVDHLYREPNLGIGALAARLQLPEHKLRRLINQGLGHRNFNAFLNTCRLADARRWLQDPAQQQTPIATIALDAGFQSLGPFNRAFKADTGMTPSEFRRAGAAGLHASAAARLADSEIG